MKKKTQHHHNFLAFSNTLEFMDILQIYLG